MPAAAARYGATVSRHVSVLALLFAVFTTWAAPAGAATSRVVTIVMENREASAVLGSGEAPYVDALARRYGVATASFGVTHPSLPNYIALTSGALHGITTNCTDCHTGARSIVDQLETARISWKAYMEGLPRPCFRGVSSGPTSSATTPSCTTTASRATQRAAGEWCRSRA